MLLRGKERIRTDMSLHRSMPYLLTVKACIEAILTDVTVLPGVVAILYPVCMCVVLCITIMPTSMMCSVFQQHFNRLQDLGMHCMAADFSELAR